MRLLLASAAATVVLAAALLLSGAPEARADHRRHGWYGHPHGWHARPHAWYGRHKRGSDFGFGSGLVFVQPGPPVYIERRPRVIVVDPDPVIVQSPGYVESAPRRAEPERYCREVNKTVVIDGRLQNAYGKACYQPDGSWQWVND